MEPSSAEDGDDQFGEHTKGLVRASMEPSSAEDGDWRLRGWIWGEGKASMEPSSAEDGDQVVPAECLNPLALQWSRPQQRTETLRQVTTEQRLEIASMEPSSAEDGDTLWLAHDGNGQ